MPKRETYAAAIECPRCKLKGQAIYSENENPVYGDGLDDAVESVPKGFEINGGSIFCLKCKEKI